MTTDTPVPSTSPQTIAFQRAAELVALADSVGINRNQIQALIAARLAEWREADEVAVRSEWGQLEMAREAKVAELEAQRDDARQQLVNLIIKVKPFADESVSFVREVQAMVDAARPMWPYAELGQQLLERAKQSCTDESIDEWAQETLELAEKLGQVGGVRQEIYDPAKHGSIDAVAGEDLIWTWDSQPRVDSANQAGETAA
jgi:hypothetical protein